MEGEKVYSWREIVAGIKSPYNTYVFVSIRNSGKSKSTVSFIKKIDCGNFFYLCHQNDKPKNVRFNFRKNLTRKPVK